MKAKKIVVFMLALCVVCAILSPAYGQTPIDETQMPVIEITLAQDAAFEEKEYLQAQVSITDFSLAVSTEVSASVRQRGNGTMSYDKKSYKIKLDEKADLFLGASETSSEAARDWVLLAEYYDRSNLRNYYTFLAASMLDGLNYVTECMFVKVYLNGEYQGVYLLCEEVEVNEARVDVDDKTTSEKGFLIELVQSNTAKQEYTLSVYHEDTLLFYDVRSNIDTDVEQSAEDYWRIYDVLEKAETALASGDQAEIAAVIDLDSCVDMYLLQEFMMNIDVGWGSFYLYCEAGEDVVYFSPPWDFDHAAGIDVRLMEASYEGLYVGSVEAHQMQSNLWYEDLMQQEWFQELVKARWNEQKEVFVQGVAEIRTVAQTYDAQFTKNYNMWHTVEEPLYMWPDYGSTYQEDADYLYDWLENRYDWLDDYFNNVM